MLRLLAVLSALVFAFGMYLYLRAGSSAPLFHDFFAFWSFAKFAAENPPALLYDVERLHAYQLRLYPGFEHYYPFPYPPVFLLWLRPLASLPYLPGALVWIGLTFAAYLVAAGGSPWCRALAAFAPTSMFAVIEGQNGFLTAALLGGGLRLLATRPVVAGVLFGALSFKPQFLALVPVALLAARAWRALAAAAVTAVSLAALSAVLFGTEMWRAWLPSTAFYLTMLDHSRDHIAPLMPTLSAALYLIGLPDRVIAPLQAVSALGIAVLVWRLFRRGPTPLAGAFLAVGLFLAIPYAFIYDLPVVTLAIVALLVSPGRDWRTPELLLLVLGLALPWFGLSGGVVSAAMPLILVALLVLIWRRAEVPATAPITFSAAGAPH